MNFMFEWQEQYLTSERSERVWYGMVWYTLFKSRNTLAPTTLSWFPWRACFYKYIKETKTNKTKKIDLKS